LVISYDTERGEPRGSRSKKAEPAKLGLGSCVDCGLCVQVCPTGIDIRQGLQYECIGCAACIDVCDGIMDKMGYQPGLIRYATQNSLNEHLDKRQILRRVFRPRVLVYTAILLLICGAFAASIALRNPFRVDVVRDRASLARIVDDGKIENVYRLQIMNSAEQVQRYALTVSGLPSIDVVGKTEFQVLPAEANWVTVAVQLPYEASQQAGSGMHPIEFHIQRLPSASESQSVTLTEKSTFMVPR
jgi:cytochrome c oxidase accessory protein FixG